MEVTSWFKELDLVDRVPEERWPEVRNIVQEAVIKTIPKKKKYTTEKWLFKEAEDLEEVYWTECLVPENGNERLESLLQRTMQKSKGKQQNGKD